jgi:hypothetical protein
LASGDLKLSDSQADLKDAKALLTLAITVLSVTPMRAGKLFALASVEIDIDGIRIEAGGNRAMRAPAGARVAGWNSRRSAMPQANRARRLS